ncbi:hypothetical protein Esi_0054_0120 [Ectocarpus siliculosus]|uniref:Uncharacterized protein n=1 Tax=Ectocarpus siliculosus TaxID=2880 RepID=D7G425_ECTSI|nr:hypothetical protein Esi_0054_0120 [Ectocarpus siliculosus]|eukprot:CBJ27060.1 hypothetical protein Esi_0054_0120 [Ectocarpus siliculosus]
MHSSGGQQRQQSQSRWSNRVQNGTQRQRTGAIDLADMQQKHAAATVGPEPDARRPLWDDELEIQDTTNGKEHVDGVEIAVVFDVKSRTTEQRETFTQSVARIDMSTFRQRSDLRTTLWVPLRPIASHLDDPFGAVKISVTYHSKDCVAQG